MSSMKIDLVRMALLASLIPALLFLSGCASRKTDQGLSGRRAEVVVAGLSQIGTPYVYGGSSPATGFDCSGLTQYAHHAAGVAIPRVAAEQHRISKPVRAGRPRPGDMVFFKTGPAVYHVGLMVDNERFVHASSSRHQVRLDRLNTPYWKAHYLGAGTYLN